MDFFEIKDYDFNPPRYERASIIILNGRKIYATDYNAEDFIEMRIDGAVLTIKMGDEINGTAMVRSTNWNTIYDLEMNKDDNLYFKDFTRL